MTSITTANALPNVSIKPANAFEPSLHAETVSATGVPLLTPAIDVTEATRSGLTEAT